MTAPIITSIVPSSGPTSGGSVVRLTGTNFADHVDVSFGSELAVVLGIHDEDGFSIIDVLSPSHSEALVDIGVQNLKSKKIQIPEEHFLLKEAYKYLRPSIAEQSNLTRLVRKLLQELKRQVIANVSLAVSVDYDDTTADGLNVVALSKLPSVVLSGPRISENRFYSVNEIQEEEFTESEFVRTRPPLTVDLIFSITGASNSTAELFNLLTAVATFVNRNKWIRLPINPRKPEAGWAKWELDLYGEARTQLDGDDDVRAFSWGFLIRGFDLTQGLPFETGHTADETELETQTIKDKGK